MPIFGYGCLMNRERIPPVWKDLYPGDAVGCRLPYHRILRHFEEMRSHGYRFGTIESPRGYLVVCIERPTMRPQLRIVK